MKFIDLWKKGRFGAENVLVTIFLIILAYLLGSSLLFIELALNFPDFSFVSNSDIKALSSLMGKNRLFIWMLIPFCFVFITFLFQEGNHEKNKNVCFFQQKKGKKKLN